MTDRSNTIRYDPVRALCNEIRLVALAPSTNFNGAIYCELHNASLNEEPEYEALSYVWGDSSDALKKKIYLAKQLFWVTPNLESALRHLRLQDRARILWIDSICINQDDLQERAEQVKIMGQIYRSACRDLLWVGADMEKYSQVLPILEHEYSSDYVTARTEYNELADNCDSAAWYQLISFFEETVWQRMWIVQELVLSKEIRIICGSRALFSTPLLPWVASTLLSPRYIPQISHEAESGSEQVARIMYLRESRSQSGKSRDLLRLWYHFGWCRCRDPRDKIFAMLGIVSDSLGIEPDYTIKTEELFSTVTRRYILQQQNLNILGYIWRLYDDKPSKIDLQNASSPQATPPSWSLDFGSDDQPYCPRFFFERSTKSAEQTTIPWNTSCSKLVGNDDNSSRLRLLGVTLDKISLTTESTRSWPGKKVVHHYFHKVTGKLGENYLPTDKYFNGDSILESYWITICGGLARIGQDSWQVLHLKSITTGRSSYRKRILSTVQRLLGRKITASVSTLNEEDLATAQTAQDNLEDHVFMTTRWSRFCMTEKGYMALVPDATRPGDLLCALRGGCTPFVLRPSPSRAQDNTQYPSQSLVQGPIQAKGDVEDIMTLIGPAYVHGFMDGLPLKWLENGTLKEHRFILV
jgi:hypothetical protein